MACSICTHAQRQSIDEELIRGTSARAIGSQFGVSRHAAHYHRTNHLTRALLKAATEAGDILSANNIKAGLESLLGEALYNAREADRAGDGMRSLRERREARELFVTLGEFFGLFSGAGVNATTDNRVQVMVQNLTDEQLEALITGAIQLPRATSEPIRLAHDVDAALDEPVQRPPGYE